MKNQKHLGLVMAAAASIAVLAGSSAFADSRPSGETWRDRGEYVVQRGDEGQRVQRFEGRISRIERDRDGRDYLMQLDGRDEWFHVPAMALRNAPGDLRTGMPVRFLGVYDGSGVVRVNEAEWIGNGYGRDDAYRDQNRGEEHVRGVVERVDRDRQTLFIRTEGRRVVAVDMDRFDRRASRMDLDDFHRGDVVTFDGFWARDVFHAARLENIRRRDRDRD